MNPLMIKFKGFSVRDDGKDEYSLFNKRLQETFHYKGVWLEGSLIKLYENGGPNFYIHDGHPQQHSGYRYIPTINKVIPESIAIIE